MNLRSLLPDRDSIATRLAGWFLLIGLVPCVFLLAVTAYYSKSIARPSTVRRAADGDLRRQGRCSSKSIISRAQGRCAMILLDAPGMIEAATPPGRSWPRSGRERSGTDEYRASWPTSFGLGWPRSPRRVRTSSASTMFDADGRPLTSSPSSRDLDFGPTPRDRGRSGPPSWPGPFGGPEGPGPAGPGSDMQSVSRPGISRLGVRGRADPQGRRRLVGDGRLGSSTPAKMFRILQHVFRPGDDRVTPPWRCVEGEEITYVAPDPVQPAGGLLATGSRRAFGIEGMDMQRPPSTGEGGAMARWWTMWGPVGGDGLDLPAVLSLGPGGQAALRRGVRAAPRQATAGDRRVHGRSPWS